MSATHPAHVRRLTTHDTVTGAVIKALFFCIEKHFQRRFTHALPVLSNFLSFFFVPDFADSAVWDDTRKCRLVRDAEGEAWALP